MRVLLITPDYPPARGGIQTLLARLVEHASRLRFSVVTLDQPGAGAYDRDRPAPVRRVRAPGPRAASIAALDAVGVAEALRTRPDLVLSGHLVTAPAADTIRRLLGAPFVQCLYAMEIPLRPAMTRFAATHACATIALSGYARSLAVDAGAPAERIHVIPPGIDLPPAAASLPAPGGVPANENSPAPAAPERSRRPTILTIARMRERYKGHDVVLRALAIVRARVPDVEWVAIGDGPLRPSLEELARALGVQRNVRFLGTVDDEERDAWLARADVFAMPSRLPGDGLAGEGFGIVFLEAAARGLPVVAGAVGGALDAVRDGETGRLVDPSDPHAVAHALIEILRDRRRAGEMGGAAVLWAQRFAWPLIAARWQELVLASVAESDGDGEGDGGGAGDGARRLFSRAGA